MAIYGPFLSFFKKEILFVFRFWDMCKGERAARDTVHQFSLRGFSATAKTTVFYPRVRKWRVCLCRQILSTLWLFHVGWPGPHYTSQECRALQKTHHNKQGPAKTLSCCNSWHFDEIGQGESKSKVRSCQVLGNSWDSEHEAESCLTPRTPERQEQSVDVDGSCGQPNHPLHLLYIHRQHHHLERWGYTRDEVLRCLS